jgi:HTH-type transcriptional regulator/antitoxin HigA
MDEMGAVTTRPRKYRELLATTLPKIIETDEELEAFSSALEALDRKATLTPEERALEALLARLIEDYDERIEFPDIPSHEMLAYLIEQKGLKQSDLIPLLGSSAHVSNLVTGKRGISKAQAKKLAEFFGVSIEFFL